MVPQFLPIIGQVLIAFEGGYRFNINKQNAVEIHKQWVRKRNLLSNLVGFLKTCLIIYAQAALYALIVWKNSMGF